MIKNFNQIKSIGKFTNKYKVYLIGFAIFSSLLILRSILLTQPEEKLTYLINKGQLLETVTITGTYTSSAQTPVYSPSNGIISELFISNHADVKKGDPLFHIESTATDEEKAIAYANYQQSLTALQTAKQAKEAADSAMWIKQKSLLDAENSLNFLNDKLAESGNNPTTKEPYTQLEIESIKSTVVTTQKDFKNAENQYKQADQNIASAQALVNSNKLAYDATKSRIVTAPSSGKVTNLLKKFGDGVGRQSDGEPVLVITSLESSAIIAKVSETDVARLIENQAANIVFDADKKITFNGRVSAIDTVGTTVGGTTTYKVRIELADFSSPIIRPGMTATITINTYLKNDIISVPNSAILYKQNQAYLKKNDKQETLIKVDLGYQGLIKTEITSELPIGLEILADVN